MVSNKNLNKKNVERFNKFFISKYDHLVNYCKKYKYDLDYLHIAYEKTLDIIKRNGWKGNNTYYTTYIINTIVNTFLNDQKHSYKKRTSFMIDERNNRSRLDVLFPELFDDTDNDEDYYKGLQYITMRLFNYIQYELKCNEFEISIFKLYYLSKEKMTYKKIQDITGCNKNKITSILRKIKLDLNNNFYNYLKQFENE